MHRSAQKLFYVLASLALVSALFVLQSEGPLEVQTVRAEIMSHLRVGFWQTVGDKPITDDILVAIDGIFAFYEQSTDAMLALIEPTSSEEDMNSMFIAMANVVTQPLIGIKSEPPPSDSGKVAGLLWDGDFMLDEPLYNLIPGYVYRDPMLSDQELSDLAFGFISKYLFPEIESEENLSWAGHIAGEYVEQPVNEIREWVTIKDNQTGQLYCFAIYNGEVNKYLGPCIYETYY